MIESFLRRALSPVVTFREGEAVTGALMFVYSFMVMAAYNIIKPTAASKFIDDLGANNVPWVFLASGITMGFIMNYYSRAVGKVSKFWVLPGTLVLVIALMLGFWSLLQTEQTWASVAYFFFGRLMLGVFLISQFWTLANDIYDPRQAKRVFGFVGGGSMLGGAAGSGLAALYAERLGTNLLILFSIALLALCFFLVLQIQRRARPDSSGRFEAEEETLGGG
ncbi:MAG TPA: MFS transporter, partial [Vicinamibacteria bacterium]